jgi:hypothetical protein
LILAHQLIAAKLNVANGVDPAPVADVIMQADNLLAQFAGPLPYGVRPSSIIGQVMINDAAVLDSFNRSELTPGCPIQHGVSVFSDRELSPPPAAVAGLPRHWWFYDPE